jgi:hypothetical protein
MPESLTNACLALALAGSDWHLHGAVGGSLVVHRQTEATSTKQHPGNVQQKSSLTQNVRQIVAEAAVVRRPGVAHM